jgi:nitrate reductase gamma subunit
MIIDWPGLGTKITNMALDAQKAAEEQIHKVVVYLGAAGVILLIIGLIFLFKKK